ncbi:hypothetical protein CLAFUW4_11064 [Fulvia fulva]|uniref:Hydrophobin 4 n=1 Tax=Passalora fulva TaxID=5499 RepID=O94202_PASFU|nr:hypothetical protein CLAFUR4_11069 [Fulvia fulva]KAK4620615.1 hypothetical protein CLAFUR0_11075 [Fulvia fulva]WPV17513.1 hypothetical protein CLAFUW4_11064 [Fulvia fulva]WPV32626.1 hypothetical protein CLAFUW7_11061 [Fulvia fulva]CAB39311.1 hydrophobin 4 [Fulvia fulva]
MQFTTFALLAVAAATASAQAPQAYYGQGAKSAQVHTFETRKAVPTRVAEVYGEHEQERVTKTKVYHALVTEEAQHHGEEHKAAPYKAYKVYSVASSYSAQPRATHAAEHYGEGKKADHYAEPAKAVHADPHHVDPVKARPTMAATEMKQPEKEAPSTVCAKGSEISCCTTDSSNSGALGNVLGGSCLLQNLSLLSSLNSNCAAANTFCCPTTQEGTLNINLSCIPISL